MYLLLVKSQCRSDITAVDALDEVVSGWLTNEVMKRITCRPPLRCARLSPT
jgi:hypothetical protein